MSKKFVKVNNQKTINVKYNEDSSIHVDINDIVNDVVFTKGQDEVRNSTYDITYSNLKNGNKKVVIDCCKATEIDGYHTESENTVTCIKNSDDNITFVMDNFGCRLSTEIINGKVFPKSMTNSIRSEEIKRDSLGRIINLVDGAILNLSFYYEDENDKVGNVIGVERGNTIRSVNVKSGNRFIRTVFVNNLPSHRFKIDYEGEIEKSRILKITEDSFNVYGNVVSTLEHIREYPNNSTNVPNKITQYYYSYNTLDGTAKRCLRSNRIFTLEKENDNPFGTWYTIKYSTGENISYKLRINVSAESNIDLESYFGCNSIIDYLSNYIYDANVNKNTIGIYSSLDKLMILGGDRTIYHSIINNYDTKNMPVSSIMYTLSTASGIRFYPGKDPITVDRKDVVFNDYLINNSLYFNLEVTGADNQNYKIEVIVTRDQNNRICKVCYKDSNDMVANVSYKYKECDDTSVTLPTSITLNGQSLKKEVSVSQGLYIEYDELNRVVKEESHYHKTFPDYDEDEDEETDEESNE